MLRSVDYFAGNLPAAAELARRPRGGGRRGRRARAVEPAGHAERRRRASARPGWPSKSGPRWPASSPTACGWSSWRRSATRPRSRRPSRPCWASRRRATPPSSTRSPRRSAAGGSCWWWTTASTSWPRRRSAIDDDPRPVRERQDPRHVARDPRGRRRDGAHRGAAGARGRRDLRCRHAVRRPGPRRPARLRAPRAGDRGRGDRDLRDPRRAPARDRAGRGADGRHERGRGQGSARRSVPAVAGVDAGARTPAHAPPRRGVVLRPPDRRRARPAPL